MKRVELLLTMSLALVSQPAAAADWKLVTVAKLGAIYFIDSSSVRTTTTGYPASSIKTAWFKADYSQDKSTQYRESKVLYNFKCESYELKIVQFISYNPDGTVGTSSPTSMYSSYSVAAPDTVGLALLEAACFNKFDE